MNDQRDLSCLLQMLFIKAEFKYKRCAKKYRYEWLLSPYQRETEVTNSHFIVWL